MAELRRHRESPEFVLPPEASGRPGPSGQPAPGGGGGKADATSLVPPGFGAVPGSSPQKNVRTQADRKRAQRKRAAERAMAAAAEPGGGPPLPPRGVRGPLPPGLGLGPGPRPPIMGGGPPLPPAVRERRDELQAVLLKRQAAGMEVSPTMLDRGDWERRQELLAGGPDIAPPSSFEELPAAAHCHWADALLLDHAQLSVQAQPGTVDHAAAMAAALAAHEAAPAGAVLLRGKAGSDFAVNAATADLLASM